MVVFTCSYCSEAVKKPSIAKHYMSKCRGPPNLTCVDCLKDFRGSEYESHIKCITEDERYAAKGFVPKASSNKGEKKQQSWFEAVQNILSTNSDLKGDERELLTILSAHENLPRKRTKFMNFLQNAHRAYARRQELVDRVWNIIEEACKPAITSEQSGKDSDKSGPKTDESNGLNNVTTGDTEIENGTATKKEKKRKAKDNNETIINGIDEKSEVSPKKKRKNDVGENMIKNIIQSEGGSLSLYKLNQKLEEHCELNGGTDKKAKLLKKITKGATFTLNDDTITLIV